MTKRFVRALLIRSVGCSGGQALAGGPVCSGWHVHHHDARRRCRCGDQRPCAALHRLRP
jgi:hypothetical protein